MPAGQSEDDLSSFFAFPSSITSLLAQIRVTSLWGGVRFYDENMIICDHHIFSLETTLELVSK